MAEDGFIAPQRLAETQQALGGELCRALDTLTGALRYRRGDAPALSPRAYIELREAKSLLSFLKYHDPLEPVPAWAMAWALKTAATACRAGGHAAEADVLGKAAALLGIDPARAYPLPAEMERKIANELALAPPLASV